MESHVWACICAEAEKALERQEEDRHTEKLRGKSRGESENKGKAGAQ